MDGEWDLGKWERTALQFTKDTTLQTIREKSEKIRALTRAIRRLPYAADAWCLRGDLLGEIGYPELAIGDLYKSRRLVEAVEKQYNGERSILGGKVVKDVIKKWQLGIRVDERSEEDWDWEEDWDDFVSGQWFRDIGARVATLLPHELFLCQCHWDALEQTRISRKRVPDAGFTSYFDTLEKASKESLEARLPLSSTFPDDDEKRTRLRLGQIEVWEYPWMDPPSEETNQSRALPDSDLVRLAPSLGQDGESTSGLFATEKLKSEQVVFHQHMLLCATNSPYHCEHCLRLLEEGSIGCKTCDLRCCSVACIERCAAHKTMCGKDFTFNDLERKIQDTFGSNHSQLTMKMELLALATSLQEPSLHPLKHPKFRHLPAAYFMNLSLPVDYI
ncbi:MAG: hypothetical protein Q9227_005743 [Pyrenula ochraceoflavens]